MPILLAVVAALGGALFWYFRLRQAGSAMHEVIDAAQRVRGRYRRRRFLGKAESSPIAAVDDPMAATVAMLIALARRPEGLALAREAAIKAEMRDVMRVPNPDEVFIFAKWVADHATDANTLSFRFSRLWKSTLSAAECQDFLAMAGRVVAAEGEPEPEQIGALKLLRDRLGLT